MGRRNRRPRLKGPLGLLPRLTRQPPRLLVEPFARKSQISRGFRAAAAAPVERASQAPGLEARERLAERLGVAHQTGQGLEQQAEPLREAFGRDRLERLGQRERAQDLVLQLAHVAGPAVREEQLLCLTREPAAGAALTRAVQREEVAREREHVLAALAERRH